MTAHYMNGYGFRTMNGLGFDAERDIRMSMFFKPYLHLRTKYYEKWPLRLITRFQFN